MLKQVTLTVLVLLAVVVVNADACPGDTNGDSQVNVPDLLNVLADWGTDGSANGGDVNGSGNVDVPDLLEVLGAWGTCVEAVPVAVLYGGGNTIGTGILGIHSHLFERGIWGVHLSLDEITQGGEGIFLGEQDVLFTDLTLLGPPIDGSQFAEVDWTTAPIDGDSLVAACVQVFAVFGGEPVGTEACALLDPQF